MSGKKPPSRPTWVKNTYFWIAAILLALGVLGLVRGDRTIRDPGQKPESSLALLYLGAAAIMLLNGYLSHRQTVQQYDEEREMERASAPKAVETGAARVAEDEESAEKDRVRTP